MIARPQGDHRRVLGGAGDQPRRGGQEGDADPAAPAPSSDRAAEPPTRRPNQADGLGAEAPGLSASRLALRPVTLGTLPPTAAGITTRPRPGMRSTTRSATPARPGGGRPSRRCGRWHRRRIASRISASVCPSRLAVGSSSSSRGASRRNARASATRWRSPPTARVPRSPTRCRDHRAGGPPAAPARRRRWPFPRRTRWRRAGPGGRCPRWCREEVRPLRDPGHLLAPDVGIEGGEVDGADPYRPGVGLDEAEHAPEQRGLAASARPGEREHLAGSDRQADPVEGRIVPSGIGAPARCRSPGPCGPGRVPGATVPNRGRAGVQHLEDLLGRAQPSALAWYSAPSWRNGR